jgi:hypothetical protein
MGMQALYAFLLLYSNYILISFLGHHDPEFSRSREWHYNSNSLKNAENHLLTHHFLDHQGDIWRAQHGNDGPQASGPVDGGYERTIPFRQQEFINAFIEWVVMDNIKSRKAASPRLKRAFKIANMQAANALPSSHNTTESWIDEMFYHFESEIKEEIKTAKSRIYCTFDGWGSKHEKISILGIVIHIVNCKGENVIRLIGLPELPNHRKRGIGKSRFLLLLQIDFCIVVLMIYESGIVQFGRSRAFLANGRASAGP